MTDHLDPAELAALPVHERLERIRESIRAKVAAAPAVDHNGRPLPARATAEEARADAEQIKAAAGPEAAGRYLRAIGHEALAGQLDPQPGPGDGGPRDPVPHRGADTVPYLLGLAEEALAKGDVQESIRLKTEADICQRTDEADLAGRGLW